MSLKYDTTIRTVTHTDRVETVHIEQIDWDYNFFDEKHTRGMCCNEEGKKQQIEELIAYLKLCEQFATADVYASSYGGWPRIWQKVLSVGMVSKWPYWEPRPSVLMTSTLGTEWFDWHSLTGAKINGNPPERARLDGRVE